jgi:hypothetical protein
VKDFLLSNSILLRNTRKESRFSSLHEYLIRHLQRFPLLLGMPSQTICREVMANTGDLKHHFFMSHVWVHEGIIIHIRTAFAAIISRPLTFSVRLFGCMAYIPQVHRCYGQSLEGRLAPRSNRTWVNSPVGLLRRTSSPRPIASAS